MDLYPDLHPYSILRLTRGMGKLSLTQLLLHFSYDFDHVIQSHLCLSRETRLLEMLQSQTFQIIHLLKWKTMENPKCRDGLAEISPHVTANMSSKKQASGLSRAAKMSGQLGLQDPLFSVLTDHLLFLQSFMSFLDLSASGLEFPYNFLVSTVALSIVYQYLIGYVDRGGTKTYNSGSLEFRATYVSLLLFQGAYVWIKFRDVANRKVSRRAKEDEFGNGIPFGKWLPKFKPPREKNTATGKSLSFQCLRLAGYDSHEDAEVVCQIAGYYYKKDEDVVQLEDGFQFDIPPMSEQEERSLSGMEKWNWVSDKAKEVFKLFKQTHDSWRAIRSVLEDDVVQTQQSTDNVNDLHDPTVPQLRSDISNVLDAVSPGTEVTRVCQEASSVQSASAPDCAAIVADAIVGNQQPLLAVPTTISERSDGILSSGCTVEAGFLCGINEEHEKGHDCWSREFQRIMSEDVELSTSEPGAGNVNDHIQLQCYVLANQSYDPACDPNLHDHTLPQPLSDVADLLDAIREQSVITSQAHEAAEEWAYKTSSTSSLEEAVEKATSDAHSEMRVPNLPDE